MMENPDADGYTITLNNWKILWNVKKIMKTKRLLKPKPTFTFTVAWWRGQFAPPAAAG